MSLFGFFSNFVRTRYGPNRPADDMEGNGEIDFRGLFEIFFRIFEDFSRNFLNFGEIGSL